MEGDYRLMHPCADNCPELDQMEESAVMDMIIESGNDACTDEYCTVTDQHAIDVF